MITPPQGSDERDATGVLAPQIPADSNYRCPVCGDWFNATSPEEILLHHEHVTHPGRFHFTKHAA